MSVIRVPFLKLKVICFKSKVIPSLVKVFLRLSYFSSNLGNRLPIIAMLFSLIAIFDAPISLPKKLAFGPSPDV